jgi:hypothetical protein
MIKHATVAAGILAIALSGITAGIASAHPRAHAARKHHSRLASKHVATSPATTASATTSSSRDTSGDSAPDLSEVLGWLVPGPSETGVPSLGLVTDIVEGLVPPS